MKPIHCKLSPAGLLLGLFLGMVTGAASAATLNLSNTPLFLANQVNPNILVMLDNSGSMKSAMYDPKWGVRTGFDPTKVYTGLFEANKNYVYDPSIPVNTAAYGVAIDPSVQGAFIESACTPAQGENTCWSGQYLNWLTTRRIDASREVLIGGKLESRTAYNYGSGLNYKLVANNERSDRSFGGQYAASDSYSPIPDGDIVTISSPADGGAIKTAYDPYAKLTFSGGLIYSDAGTKIGEFGQVKTDEKWVTVNLKNSYADPVVIAKPPTLAGSQASIVRIKSVVGTSFAVQIQEYDYLDGGHADESISYIVVEAGVHTLHGGTRLIADTREVEETNVTGGCGSAQTGYETVSFGSAFSSAPVVVSSVMTMNSSDAVNSRSWDIDASGFKLAMQEEEAGGAHADETIGYIAIEPGQINDTTSQFYLEAGIESSVDEDAETIGFSTTFDTTPVFVAAMQSMNDGDTAILRLDSVSASSATLHVQEEQSCDTEVDHGDEEVGYIAVAGSSQSLNIAVAVADEPTGLLQDVDGDVVMGISFYRYDPNSSDIYNSETSDGGTLKFKIPRNPFVKKPSDTSLPATEQGYRNLTGYVGTSIADIVDAIEHYPLVWGTTPIAENLWEVVQYFEQDTPHYPDVVSGFKNFDKADAGNPGRDPFYSTIYDQKLMCTRSNVLIFTDGEPYKDANIPSSVVDYDDDSASDDYDSTDPNSHGRDNLDDVAYWAYCDKSKGACTNGADGSRDLRSDIDGDQYLRIDTVGFAGGTIRPILQDAADNAGGTAYAAEDGLALKTALTAAFNQVISVGSASAVATNSTRLDTNALIYQGRFDSAEWTGQLLAYAVDPNDGSIATTPTWNTDTAGLIPSYGSRSVFSYNPDATTTKGITFSWANLDATTQQPSLRLAGETDDTLAQARVSYLGGDTSNEVRNGGQFRDRTKLLGDIINSNPWFVGVDNYGYTDLPGAEGSSYQSYLASVSSRSKMLYVGANDGMLHAINAATGAELFAYVPGVLIPELKNLTQTTYGTSLPHQYFVDGSPRAGDVYFSSSAGWHTVLVGTMGAGARAVFALDVTDPDNFSASDVLWEFTNSSTDGADLGYTLTEPTIAKMANGKWAAIIGNGYNSDNGHAVLYILDIETGSVIKKIDTQAGSTAVPNGLATPIPIDDDGDRIVDAIYAGDLLGNMWKFDVSATSESSWGPAFGTVLAPQPLYVAKDSNSVVQPITSKPQVGLHPNGGIMVYFGTGKYFESDDNIVGLTPQVQTYYGIRDNYSNGSATPVSGRASLVEQTIDAEASASSVQVRVTSNNTVNYSSKSGWFMDLVSPVSGAEGERVISPSLLRGERLIFTTVIPSGDACAAGGTSWLMELDAVSGGRLYITPFDINADGLFTSADLVSILDTNNDGIIDGSDDQLVVSGKKSTIGIIKTPSVISAGTKEYKYTSGSSGGLEATTESAGLNSGRQSWRQLR